MIPIFGSYEDTIPDLRPDRDARNRMQRRIDRLHSDPEYRAQQRLRAQIAADNSHKARGLRNTKVSLPKFSWDEP